MIEATMPKEYRFCFRPHNPFPSDIIDQAGKELDQLVSLLQGEGVQVRRSEVVNWNSVRGYTGAMPRDGLMTVGNHIIEGAFCKEMPSRRN